MPNPLGEGQGYLAASNWCLGTSCKAEGVDSTHAIRQGECFDNLLAMSKIETYRTYTIKSFPVQELDTGQWRVDIKISWKGEGALTIRPFCVEQTHPTQEEAEIHGIIYGQSIIDGNVPGVSLG